LTDVDRKQFKNVFAHFHTEIGDKRSKDQIKDSEQNNDKNDDQDMETQEEDQKLSKKKLKELNRMKVSELKQQVKRPEIVESWDVTAQDPLFLTWLK
jgi:splicing factor 3B subunit 2